MTGRGETAGARRLPAAVRLLGLLIVPAAAGIVFLVGFHSLIEEDFWWHVRAGSDIVAGEGIPRVDTYSYPSEGRPYVDLHWLFQVLIHLLFKAGGEDGVIWAKCLVALAVFGFVYRLSRRRAPPPLAATITALGAVVASERILARPELFSYLLLAVSLWMLRRHEEGARRSWVALPFVMLLWVNIEGLFVLGFIVIAAHLAGRLRDGRLWAALGLSILASLINPYFLTGALHPFVLFTRISGAMSIYSQTIGEFLSPFDRSIVHPATVVFPYYLAAAVAGLVLYAQRPRVSEVILVAGFTYLAFAARRNLAPFAIVTVPIVSRWIGEGIDRRWIRSLWGRFPGALRGTVAVAVAVAVLAAMAGYGLALRSGAVYGAAQTNRRFGTEKAPTAFPRQAVEFLKENEIEGPIFHLLSAGGYLIYAYPEEKVFIDGRLEVHTAEHYARALTLGAGGEAWVRADKEFGFQCLLLNYASAVPLTVERLQDRAWAPVHLDDTAIVFVRDTPEHAGVIGRCAITRAGLLETYPSFGEADLDAIPRVGRRTPLTWFFRREPFPWSELYLGQFLELIRLPELAAQQYARSARSAPHLLKPRLLLARALRAMGDEERALRVLEEAVPLCTGTGIAAAEEELRRMQGR